MNDAYTISLGNWDTLKTDAQAIRIEVFVVEQNVPPELEMDEMDALCLHAVAYDPSGHPVGTGRLLPDGHIGRMAVRKVARGAGIGGLLLRGLMARAQARGDASVVLNAQTQAAPFYQRHGFFIADRGEFLDAGIPHVEMRLDFSPVAK